MTTNSTSSESGRDISEKNEILKREFGLEIRINPERGRHLVACKTFSPGSTLYCAEPYAAVLKTKYIAVYHLYNETLLFVFFSDPFLAASLFRMFQKSR
jgi:hypothetical protein